MPCEAALGREAQKQDSRSGLRHPYQDEEATRELGWNIPRGRKRHGLLWVDSTWHEHTDLQIQSPQNEVYSLALHTWQGTIIMSIYTTDYHLKLSTCFSNFFFTLARRLIWSSERVLLVLPGVLVGSDPSASTLGQTFKSCIPWRNMLGKKNVQDRINLVHYGKF